ncbi:proline-specific permease [Podospora didyma]|uniref:Proline-specific permease n=1 Tax=Podospora didyma TaxID=330526 RepID=A0AAE0U095_9PEZI|nr:proline-specific permease [Podospora didyma]
MDYDTPEVVNPHLYPGNQVPSTPENEETLQGDVKRDRYHGESLWRDLHERHINMIAFTGTVGNGLFLGSGTSIAAAGPGGAVLGYILMGTVISSVMSGLGEMTALLPVNAPVMEFPRRFLDRGVGFTVGWMYWFAFAVTSGTNLVAVSNTIKFLYDDGRTRLAWQTGLDVDSAIWVSTFLALVTIINLCPVRYYGELEYVFGCIKLAFIVFLIMLMLVLSTMQPTGNAYHDQAPGSKYWNEPWGFFQTNYTVTGDFDGEIQRAIGGSTGTFLGVWTTFIDIFFSYVGMDVFAATAAESRPLSDAAESYKMATRKINIRVILLYTLAVLTASFVVPSTHPFLNGHATSVSAKSIFIIAAVEAGMPGLAHFLNGVYVFSSVTCCSNNVYVASRVLHTLALRGQTGPEFITRRLRACRSGVPVRAVIVSALVALLGYMGRTGSLGQRLGELRNYCTVTWLVVYLVIGATYVSFYKTLKEAKSYATTSETQAASYDRNSPFYPYKSHGQWLKAAYGCGGCIIVLLFNGVPTLLQSPIDVNKFISAYINIPIFLALLLGYKIKKHGFRISAWGPERSNDLSNAVQATSPNRKGRLEFPDDALFTKDNLRFFAGWVWVWLK